MKFDVGNRNRLAWLAFAAELIGCAAVYAPGLRGSFVFDDSTFIIANQAMHVTTLRLGDWVAAALSFPSSHQGRWLGMLSFAVNHYFTGLDPFWLKLTNLVIHLANGVLVFGMFRALFALWRECRADLAARHPFDARMAAAVLAGLWLLLPINVTAVLYVSQRLESLSNTFVFLGLWWYLHARRSHWRGESRPLGLWMSLVVSTGIGVLVKESAAMLPLYALCAEFAVTSGRNRDGRRSHAVAALYGTLIGVPLVVGGFWLMSWVGSASSYARPFGTIERLLTESRVLLDYIRWTLLPQPEALTLYHDDIAVSHGLIDPPSTLAAVVALLALFAAAIRQRARRPLFTLGVLWFFAGHALTGTVIPLMLAFEHRNYFPSTGLLLAGASLVALEGGLGRQRTRLALAVCAFAFYSFVTWMRAEEWSDPLRLALSEANKRPDSSEAQYELASMLLHSYRKDEMEPMIREAYDVLERAYRIPGSDIVHEELLIVGHAQNEQPVDPVWWDSMLRKLQSRPPTTSDISALTELLRCTREGVCKDVGRLSKVFEAAIAHPSPNSVLLSAYGEFAEHLLRDSALAEKLFREALAVAPMEPTTHENLITFLIHHGRFDEARAELDALRRMNHLGALDPRIARLDAELSTATTSQAAEAEGGTADPQSQ
jgi:hypothetical protein